MNSKFKIYHLERYRGRSTRHECPKCKDKRSFTYYVDDAGHILDKTVGRCDHESSCGYHYTPKQYFTDNSTAATGRPPQWAIVPPPPLPPKPDYIDKDYLLRSFGYNSSLVFYLCGVFPKSDIMRVWEMYGVGHTKDMGVIYWQIDTAGKVRAGKIVKYDGETGHRLKAAGANWVHYILKRKKLLPDTFNLVQCLFGEHLLTKYPGRTVALVEAEKTALIGAMQYPDYVWLATGGKSQMSVGKMAVLRGRKVIAFPDADGYQEWRAKAKELAKVGVLLQVSDYIERHATPEQKAHGADIADLILAEREAAPPPAYSHGLMTMVEQSPALQTLIDKLDLEEVS